MARSRRGSPLRGLMTFVWTVGMLALAAGAWLIWEIHRDGPATQTTVFEAPRGASVGRIANALHGEGLIRSPEFFRIAARLYASEGVLKAGRYEVKRGESLRSLVEKLESGRTMVVPITFPEGITVGMAMDIIDASPVLTGPMPPTPPEGSLLPETYAVDAGMTRAALVAQMRKAHDDVLAELWAKRAPDLPIKTPQEAVILASIVEKETGIAEERPRVAAVFTNRLRRGMRLESDPTIIYGVSQGRPLGRGIRRSELDRKTPYNTYHIDGLPPTPISNPGRAALEAVLNPPETDDIFFVADGTGGHAFAATLEEHNANVARWRAIERQRQTSPSP